MSLYWIRVFGLKVTAA